MGTGIIRNTAKRAWNSVKSWFGGSSDEVSRDVGSSEAFEIERANAQKIQRMSEELLEYSKKYTVKSNELERDVFEQINDVIDEIIYSLSEVENMRIDGKKVRINLRALRKEMSKFEKSKRGCFINEIHKALSIDNKECLEILKLDSGKEKQNEMRNFLRKILKNELKNLALLAKNTLEENLSFLSESLNDKIIEIEESINEEIENFKKLEDSREKGIKDRDLLLKNKIREKIMYRGILNEKI